MSRSIKRHTKLLSLTILAIIVVAVTLLLSSLQEDSYSLHFPGRFFILPFLTVEVSPPGYPQIGESWKIEVYFANSTRNGQPVYEPACNATLFVTLLEEGYPKVFEKTTNGNGETSFQCTSHHEAITFEAHYSGLSRKVTITGNFASSNVVNTLLTFNLFSIIGSLASDMLLKPEKSDKLKDWKKLLTLILIGSLCLFSFVTLTSLYVKLFRETTWGYPENIIGSLITLTSLSYIFYAAVICLFVYWIMKLIIRGLETTEEG